MNTLRRLKQFTAEVEGQATIEYLLILGGAMLAAVMFASSYKKMGYRSVYNYNLSIQETQEIVCDYFKKYLEVAEC